MVSNTKNFFIKIDEFIFHKIDLLKNDSSFQKMNDYLAGLEENQQKIFAQLLTFAFLIVPFIFVATLWWGNHKTKKNIDIKNQILEQMAMLNGNKDTLTTISASYVSPKSITSREDLEQRIINMISPAGIDTGKVQVVGFNQVSTSSTISKIEAQVNFKSFGTQDFSTFMRTLVDQEKFKIMRLDLKKDTTTNLLQGQVTLLHLGKNAAF